MDDVLLDTLARTATTHRMTMWGETLCHCGWSPEEGTAWSSDKHGRHKIEALLAVTGDDGVPLLQVRSDHLKALLDDAEKAAHDCIVAIRAASSVIGTEETNA